MPGPSGSKTSRDATPKFRLDKWLFQARFFRSREAAGTVVSQGHLRINGQRCRKPGHGVGPGDVLTFVQAGHVRVVRILEIGQRRGPADEARALYLDLDESRPEDGAGSALE